MKLVGERVFSQAVMMAFEKVDEKAALLDSLMVEMMALHHNIYTQSHLDNSTN